MWDTRQTFGSTKLTRITRVNGQDYPIQWDSKHRELYVTLPSGRVSAPTLDLLEARLDQEIITRSRRHGA